MTREIKRSEGRGTEGGICRRRESKLGKQSDGAYETHVGTHVLPLHRVAY